LPPVGICAHAALVRMAISRMMFHSFCIAVSSRAVDDISILVEIKDA
jgi:hypothetical protein